MYYHYLRNAKGGAVTGADETILRNGDLPRTVSYGTAVPYEAWMDGATLQVEKCIYGCCEEKTVATPLAIASYSAPEVEIPRKPFVPDYVYFRPKGESVKSRSISGKAYLDFRVNRTDIDPEYHDNGRELALISATIDTVRNNPDCSINRLFLKGYASPEGRYENNARLAEGRTAALRKYVSNLYRFDKGVIQTESEAENWDGLREYVENSDRREAKAVLEVIDGQLGHDAKERKIRNDWPDFWKDLTENCLPYLRRTDYEVEYTVRSYAGADEILAVLEKNPQNLSLEEFYLAAHAYPAGSAEFNRIFNKALQYYPADEAANLNAANIDMQSGDLSAAEARLAKAGDSAEAEYARGNLAALRERDDEAEIHFRRAAQLGLKQASAALERLEQGKAKTTKQ